PERNKIFIIKAATFLASSSVAVSGIISLVGLMIPHLVRMIIGPDNTKVIPISICLGASYIAVVDTLSRSLFNFEVPIGIFTTLLGAPFFIVLLRKTRAGGWH
ncbi:MAG: iron ABC transporter permease, partial [Clostridiaceae bacterium]|nr:iron ABC transporter permease [Clostridiaceae bacterium]